MAINSFDDDTFFGAYNRVARFDGTAEQRELNRASHDWCSEEDEDCVEGACRVCCAQIWDHTADWPCGKAMREHVSRTERR